MKESTVELGQTQQRVSDLFFYLYRRALHPELFCIHRTEQVQRSRYRVDIWVMGLSHAVSVQVNSGCLTELTCDETDLLPANGLAASFRMRGERDHTEPAVNGLRYMMSSQVERLTQNLFEATHRDLVRHSQQRGLFVSFAEWAGEGLAPFTYIEHEARHREFHVYAYHAYPDDLTIVKTQSIFEIA